MKDDIRGLFLSDRTLTLMDALGIPIESSLKKAAILYDKIYGYTPNHIVKSPFDPEGYYKFNLLNSIGFRLPEKFYDEIFIATKEFMKEFHEGYWQVISNVKLISQGNPYSDEVKELFKRHDFWPYSYENLFEEGIASNPPIEDFTNTLAVETNVSAYLSNYRPELSIFTTPLHIDYQKTMLNLTPKNEVSIFGNIVRAELFDFSKLSWDNIMTLRRSEFCKSFRNHFFELLESIPTENDQLTVLRLNDYIFDTSFEFLKEHRPKPNKSLLTAIVSNIPIPMIPLNPISVYQSVKTINQEAKNRKKYGWLHFLQEVDSSLKKSQST